MDDASDLEYSVGTRDRTGRAGGGHAMSEIVTPESRFTTGAQEIGEVVKLEQDESFAVDEEYPDPDSDSVEVEVSDDVLGELEDGV
jgi:hypothetical protein